MRDITFKVYQFSELSEEAKQKAIENCREFALEDQWYEFIYEDAKTIGLEITGFDLDRGRYCKGEFSKHPLDVVREIIKNHGEQCETYKTAMRYAPALKLASDANDDEALANTEHEFLNDLLEDYRAMLQQEYEYRNSDEAIKEMIEANEYEFLANGSFPKYGV